MFCLVNCGILAEGIESAPRHGFATLGALSPTSMVKTAVIGTMPGMTPRFCDELARMVPFQIGVLIWFVKLILLRLAALTCCCQCLDEGVEYKETQSRRRAQQSNRPKIKLQKFNWFA